MFRISKDFSIECLEAFWSVICFLFIDVSLHFVFERSIDLKARKFIRQKISNQLIGINEMHSIKEKKRILQKMKKELT